MGIFDSVAMGFATISPVVGLYAVVLVGMVVAGRRVGVGAAGRARRPVPAARASTPSSPAKFPLANGAYQWSRRLLGPAYGWFNGWVGLCAYAVANTTIAYLGAPWALALLDITPTAGRARARRVRARAGLLGGATRSASNVIPRRAVNARHRRPGRRRAGHRNRAAARVPGPAVRVAHGHARRRGAVGRHRRACGAARGARRGGLGVRRLRRPCVMTAPRRPAAPPRQVPRAVWIALLSVGALIILNAVAVGLAHPDPTAIVAGTDTDPVTTAVVGSFGLLVEQAVRRDRADSPSWRAASPLRAPRRAGSSLLARDGALPRVPASCAGWIAGGVPVGGARRDDRHRERPALLLALDAVVIASLIVFGTAALYLRLPARRRWRRSVARLRGTWVPAGRVSLGRAGVVDVLAVAWLAFETVNIAWPREAPRRTRRPPVYQLWAGPIVLVPHRGSPGWRTSRSRDPIRHAEVFPSQPCKSGAACREKSVY